ncbi:uncharacterized protein L969DRAFT_100633 [Mixia osmundae IAM 14324]|uniref:GRAM domain-containing protein n=1 Tax=Mixia osmundae (strain CBS 9802 / IAM 14324 / JCM 22182 / KY 12970) TaxID=764103 RepID=G7DZV6_MIXOS|nr:uncharacterized protein L969DRAFT_100633 [Mixia osmundae IAM 14324]KEI42109.1 hypothetical protein L969DRAFT_100633 [Mixia osmundae IAM 14324]GAA96116.1 hypothetical protein E5Q_02777 [Mixia osmundae IAM 14324]
MSLNWAMLTPDGRQPVPLPGESFVISLDSIDVSIQAASADRTVAAPESREMRARGRLWLSPRRVVFVASSGNASTSSELRSFSVPLTKLHDMRYVQPYFSANRMDACVVPVPGGGLSTPQLLKIIFSGSPGFKFYELLQDAKSRASAGNSNAEGEALPLYEPPNPPAAIVQPDGAATHAPETERPTETAEQPPHDGLPPPAYDI